MDDIVTRLRGKYQGQLPICDEAADEIERLRALLAHGLTKAYDCQGCDLCTQLKEIHMKAVWSTDTWTVIMSLEPKFHFFEDCLPDNDPRSRTTIYCGDCARMVHCENNETMNAWLDTGIGEICLDCFYKRYDTLPSLGEPWSFDELEWRHG